MSTKAVSLALLVLFLSTAFIACVGPRGWPGASVEGGTLFVGTMDGRVLALNPDDASLEWDWQPSKTTVTNPIGCGGGLAARGGKFYGSPVIAQGIAYVGTFTGQVYAIDAATGQEIWNYNIKSAIVGGMAVNNSTLFLGTSDGKLHALDISGDYPSEVFVFRAGGSIWSTPVVHDNIVYFGSLDHNLYAVDATTGQTKWVFKASGEIAATPLVFGGIVYVGSLDNKLYAVDADTGQPRWVFEEAGNWFWSNPVYSNSTIYAGSFDHYVYAIDAGNGTPVWPKPFETGGRIYSSPTVSGETLVVASDDGKIYGIDLAAGTERWQLDTKSKPLSSLCALGDQVYANTQDNVLWAVNARNGAVIWRLSFGKGEVRKLD
jgi:outer membrane protein assembly factor BamB